MAILDTCFIIDYFNNNAEAIAYFNRLVETQEDIVTTVINIYELEVGLRKSPHKEKHQKAINELQKIAKIFDINPKTISIAVKIQNNLANKGGIIDDFDVFIAAVCIANNEKLITRNIRHFERIENLKIEKY